MGLITPLFLAGLAAVAIPILVHLVRREERASFAFPSLMFLKRIPVHERRRRTIRHWWLLALRCLIVVLLSFAFARPFIEEPTSTVGIFNEGRDRIIVLDRSLSMQSASQWNDALQIAGEAVDALGSGDRGALVLFDHDSLLARELTLDHASLREALSNAEPGDGNTDLTGAIARGSALLEESNAAIREIVLISDFQRSAVESSEHVGIAAGVDIIPRSVAGGGGANASIAAVKLARQLYGTGLTEAVEFVGGLGGAPASAAPNP